MNKLVEIKFGSHLYGTDTDQSDLDLKSIYLPSAREIVLGKYDKVKNITRKKKECERNNKEDIDIEIFSLDRFLYDLMDGQTWSLDLLFAPESFYTEYTCHGLNLMTHIRNNKDRLLTRNLNSFISYARKQAAKYGIKGSRMDALKRTVEMLKTIPDWDRLKEHEEKINKLIEECSGFISLENTPLVEISMVLGPNKIDVMPHLHVCGRKISFTSTIKHAKECYSKILNEYGDRAHKANLTGNKDFKALSHSVRVNSEALEVLQTGSIVFPRPDRDMLIKIKTGQIDYEVVAEIIENGLIILNDAFEKSNLRDKPDMEWAQNLIYEEYSKIVKDN